MLHAARDASPDCGVRSLCALDPDLARLHARYGDPPAFRRAPGFASLLHIILEQQVSLASARVAFERLARLGPITPERFLAHSDDALRAVGFSRQKARYGRLLAGSVLDGTLPLDDLVDLPDDTARALLTAQTGIGRWTADIYLLMALARPDVFPVGDLALSLAVQRVKNLALRPAPDALGAIAAPWSPHRSSAARLLWHAYVQGGP